MNKFLCRRLTALFIATAGISGCNMDWSISETCDRGYKLVTSGQFQESMPVLTACAESKWASPTLRRHAYIARAWANQNLGNLTAAVVDQESAFQIDSEKSYQELINYALYLRAAGRASDSLIPLRSAEAIDKSKGWTSMVTQYHLGWTFQELKRHEDAVAAFSRGIPNQPEFAYAYYRRGLSLEALGKKKLARADFEKVGQLIKRPDRGNTSETEIPVLRKKLDEYGIQ